MRADPGEQHWRANRLGHIVDRANLKTLGLVDRIGQRSDEDDRDVDGAALLLEHAAGVESTHIGHHHVAKNEIRSVLLGDVKRLHAVLGEQ